MGKRCEIYWSQFVASQVNAQAARSDSERIVWLQVAEMWLTLAQAEHVLAINPLHSRLGRFVLH